MNINTSPKSNKILGLSVDSRPAHAQMRSLRLVDRVEHVADRVKDRAENAFKTMLPKFPHKNL